MSDSEDEQSANGPSRNLDNKDLPALFWDSMPDNAEEHPDYVAMQALAEESTPEERAENFKVQGNNKLKVGLQAKNKLLLREAISFYDQGLKLKCKDGELVAALLNNRAHVNSLLGNWRAALQDSEIVLQLQPANLKAVFRAARAAAKLKEWEKCSRLVEDGLKVEPGAPELLQIQKDVSQQQQQEAEIAKKLEQARLETEKPARMLAAALLQKGYKLTIPQASVGARKPYVDAKGCIHWPVLLIYPETMQQDVVEDWHEGETLADHLDVMFGPGAPPLEWDQEREYTRDRVELYYLANAGKQLKQEELVQAMQGKWPAQIEDAAAAGPQRYGAAAAIWVKADERQALGQVLLQPGHLIAGVPLFWVVAKGTEYKERFLKKARQ